ncbi:hypothetical protein C0J52_21922 [Blattella germanica]|nr:hypothetical protein C0J52_21922 [Blattella germanica]
MSERERWKVIPSSEKKLFFQDLVFWRSSSMTRRTETNSSVGSLKLYLEMICGHMKSTVAIWNIIL